MVLKKIHGYRDQRWYEGKADTLHTADPGLIPDTTYGLPTTTRSSLEHAPHTHTNIVIEGGWCGLAIEHFSLIYKAPDLTPTVEKKTKERGK